MWYIYVICFFKKTFIENKDFSLEIANQIAIMSII